MSEKINEAKVVFSNFSKYLINLLKKIDEGEYKLELIDNLLNGINKMKEFTDENSEEDSESILSLEKNDAFYNSESDTEKPIFPNKNKDVLFDLFINNTNKNTNVDRFIKKSFVY